MTIIVIVLMALVAIVNMVTALLILIIERTRFIGILKAMGSRNGGIMQVFIWSAVRIIVSGLLWGNVLGLCICLVQKYGHVIKLNPESYYVSYAPIDFNIPFIIFMNLGTMLLCSVCLFLPVLVVLGISPVKAIRFE
jgi:lipoprotein-releasing system permease protein